MQKFLLTLSALAVWSLGAAQNDNAVSSKTIAAVNPPQEIDWENFDQYLADQANAANTEFAHINQQQNILFIDFQQVQANSADKAPLQRLYVWSSDKKLVFYDDALASLPQDATYEIDLRELPADTYRVELFKSKDNVVEFQFGRE